MSNSLRPHGLQHTRPPCPSPAPGVCSNSCPLSHHWLSGITNERVMANTVYCKTWKCYTWENLKCLENVTYKECINFFSPQYSSLILLKFYTFWVRDWAVIILFWCSLWVYIEMKNFFLLFVSLLSNLVGSFLCFVEFEMAYSDVIQRKLKRVGKWEGVV